LPVPLQRHAFVQVTAPADNAMCRGSVWRWIRASRKRSRSRCN
jgi:hypothetical protein